jgi:UPF0716 protein FxsA
MNVAKWLLYALLMLPLAELAAFIAVAAAVGFLWAVALLAAGSLAGALILRRAGGNHIARMRVVLGDNRLTGLQADGAGTAILIAGFLLLIPGFITDVLALLLLIGPLRRAAGKALRGAAAPSDGVVDQPPEQWHQIPDPSLPRPERER